MLQRYMEVKAETPGTILLFRMGDFYELFFEDAVLAAKVLGLTLTSRDKGSTNPVPMAGFPFHALEGYLKKLIHAGHRAAICDQVEDPRTAKGMVRREITRIVTPGTLTDETLLDPRASNYIAAVCPIKGAVGLAWLDVSTGRFQCVELRDAPARLRSRLAARARGQSGATDMTGATDVTGADSAAMPHSFGGDAVSIALDELARLRPAECLIPDAARGEPLCIRLAEIDRLTVTERPMWAFAANQSRETLLRHFDTQTLAGFDLGEEDSAGIAAAGALLEYVIET